MRYGQLSVVDGQQGLTTNYKAYSNHEDYINKKLSLRNPEVTNALFKIES